MKLIALNPNSYLMAVDALLEAARSAMFMCPQARRGQFAHAGAKVQNWDERNDSILLLAYTLLLLRAQTTRDIALLLLSSAENRQEVPCDAESPKIFHMDADDEQRRRARAAARDGSDLLHQPQDTPRRPSGGASGTCAYSDALDPAAVATATLIPLPPPVGSALADARRPNVGRHSSLAGLRRVRRGR